MTRFGPLSVGIQTQGVIALSRLNRQPLRVSRGNAERLVSALQRKYIEHSLTLSRDPEARKCFHWDGGSVRRTKSRLPDQKEERLAPWLERTLQCVPGTHPREHAEVFQRNFFGH